MPSPVEVAPIIIIIIAMFAFFAVLAPAKKKEEESPPLTDEEVDSFRLWVPGSAIIWVVSLAVFGFLLHLAFRGMGSLLSRPGSTTAFVIAPDLDMLTVLGGLLGVACSLPATELTLRVLLGSRHQRFERWVNRAEFFNTNQVAIGLCIFILLAAAAGWFYYCTSITRIGPDGIALGRAWSFTNERIAYSHVRSVQLRDSFRVPNGSLIPSQHYAIAFDDGREYLTRWFLRKSLPEDAQAMAYVAQRAGLAIQRPR